MADNYGAPLNGYPGTSRNNSSQQMMEGIINTVSSEMEDSKLFAHIKVKCLSLIYIYFITLIYICYLYEIVNYIKLASPLH